MHACTRPACGPLLLSHRPRPTQYCPSAQVPSSLTPSLNTNALLLPPHVCSSCVVTRFRLELAAPLAGTVKCVQRGTRVSRAGAGALTGQVAVRPPAAVAVLSDICR